MAQKKRILWYMNLSVFLGYLPWYNFSAVVDYLVESIHLTASDIGLIISSFQIGYVVVVIATGRLADLIGPKKVIAGAILCSGVFSTLFALFGNSLTTILIFRLLSGLASGAVYAPGLALLSQWFEPHERGRALGAYTAATVAAYSGGYFVAGPVAAAFGWRMGVLITSLPALIGFWIVLSRIPEVPESPSSEARLASSGVSGASSAGVRFFSDARAFLAPMVLITLAYMGHMWELFAFWGWIGPFLVSSFAAVPMEIPAAVALGGTLAAFIVLVGVPGSVLIGIAADKFGPLRMILLASLLSAFPNALFGWLHGRGIGVVLLAGLWIGFWIVADSALFKVVLTQVVPAQWRATALGIQSAGGFGMTVFAPVVFGHLLAAYNGPVSTLQAAVWWPSFLSLGTGSLIAPLFTLVFLLWMRAAGKTS